RALVTASFVTPPFLGAIAWELLAAPNSGLLNQLYRGFIGDPGADPLFDIYTLPGLIFVISCYTFPYVFVLVANALDRIPGDLEDASSILGGRMWVTARRVTIPLALLALLDGALLNAAFSPVATQFVTLGTATLHNIHFVFFELSATKLAFKNTFILGFLSATIGTIIAVVISYITARKSIAGWRALAFLATAP